MGYAVRLPPEFGAQLLRLAAVSAIAFATMAATPVPPTISEANAVASAIERTLDGAQPVETLANESVDGSALTGFYRARHWTPLWTGRAAPVIDALSKAGDDGLASLPLHMKAIAARIDAAPPAKAAEGDMLLTDAVMRFASAMRGQRVDPSDIEDDWFVPTPNFDAVDYLTKHEDDIVPALGALAPAYNGYKVLRDALVKMRANLAQDWPKVPPGPTVRPDEINDVIPFVRRRLIATGELTAENADSRVYDATLKAAVMLFQAHNGLDADGALGPRTILALNASPAQRARTIALNMERWRWLPPHLEGEHIFVNVPAEELQLVSDNQVVLEMKAIVGDLDHPDARLARAPEFTGAVTPIGGCRPGSRPTRSCRSFSATPDTWPRTISNSSPITSCRAAPRARARASPGSR